jgi:D-amino-acid dehydrogenase
MVNGLLTEGGLERRELKPARSARSSRRCTATSSAAFLTESDSSGDIHKFTTGLARAAARRGADLRFGTEVDAVAAVDGGVRIVSGGREEAFDGVVVSAGIRSRAIAQALGDRVNIYPVKGYSITVQLDDAESQAAAPWISLLDDRAKIVASRFGRDRFRIAGTAEFNGANKDIRADRIRPLVEWCEKHFPAISTEHVTPWAGLRPMTPSMLPRRRPRPEAGRLLQHRPRPPRLDPVGRHRRIAAELAERVAAAELPA